MEQKEMALLLDIYSWAYKNNKKNKTKNLLKAK